MRTLAVRTLVTAAVAMASGLSIAAAGPQYIGGVTGHAERDTYASVVAYADTQALCLAGPAVYFGTVTGNAEKDAFGHPVKLVAGSTCPDEGSVAAAQ